MLDLDLQQIISQALSFIILLWILRRFAWKPLLNALDARRMHIEDELKKVSDMHSLASSDWHSLAGFSGSSCLDF